MALIPNLVPGKPYTFQEEMPETPDAAVTITVKDPTDTIVSTGPATLVSGTLYSFAFTVPASAATGQWGVEWAYTFDSGVSNRTIGRGFVVVTTTGEAEYKQTYAIMASQRDHIELYVDHPVTDLKATLQQIGSLEGVKYPSNPVLQTGTLANNLIVEEALVDGGVRYKFWTPANGVAEGEFLVIWSYRDTDTSPTQRVTDVMWSIPAFAWSLIKQLRQYVDKIQKRTGIIQAYNDAELMNNIAKGIQMVNGVVPLSEWTYATLPWKFFELYIIKAAALWTLRTQYLLEGDLQFCLDLDSNVYTSTGWQKLRNVTPKGSPVVRELEIFAKTGNNDFQCTSNSANWGSTDVVKVTTEMGYDIVCTEQHKVLIYNPETMAHSWKPVKEISLGDYMCVSREGEEENFGLVDISLEMEKAVVEITSNEATRNYKLPEFAPAEVTPEFARLLAYFIAEGCATSKTLLSFCNTDDAILEDFKACAKESFGEDCLTYDGCVGTRETKFPEGITYTCSKPVYNYSLVSTIIRNFMFKIGIDYTISKYKIVPRVIFESPLYVVREFLRAYLDCDGCVTENSFLFCSTSQDILKGIQLLLLRFGILASRGDKVLAIRGEQAQKYSEIIGTHTKPNIYKAGARWQPKHDYVPNALNIINDGTKSVRDTRGWFVKSDGERVRLKVDWHSLTTADPSSSLEKTYWHHIETYVKKAEKDLEICNPELLDKLRNIQRLHYAYLPIKTIEKIGKRLVGDLMFDPRNLDVLDHSFVAEGFVVHNSFSAQTISLEYDHLGFLSEEIGRLEDDINNPQKLALTKKDYLQRVGVGVVLGVRTRRVEIYRWQ